MVNDLFAFYIRIIFSRTSVKQVSYLYVLSEFIHMIILHSKFRTRWIIKVNLTFLKYLQRPVFFATMVLRSGRILYVLATDKKIL